MKATERLALQHTKPLGGTASFSDHLQLRTKAKGESLVLPSIVAVIRVSKLATSNWGRLGAPSNLSA